MAKCKQLMLPLWIYHKYHVLLRSFNCIALIVHGSCSVTHKVSLSPVATGLLVGALIGQFESNPSGGSVSHMFTPSNCWWSLHHRQPRCQQLFLVLPHSLCTFHFIMWPNVLGFIPCAVGWITCSFTKHPNRVFWDLEWHNDAFDVLEVE